MKNKEFIKRRFSASFRQYDLLAHTQREICARLADMLATAAQSDVGGAAVMRAMEIGAGTGFLTRHLVRAYPHAHWVVNDLAGESRSYLDPIVEGISHDYLWGDAEMLEFPDNIDLIASSSTVQWMDDLPLFLQKCADATTDGGWLAVSTFGQSNFTEIKSLTGTGLEYPTPPQLEAIFDRAGYRLLAKEQYIERLHFSSPAEVLRHIRATGVGMADATPWTRGRLEDFTRHYEQLFPHPEGGVGLTYHPVLMVARSIRNRQ